MKQSLGNHGLIFPNPVLVVGTYDVNGEPNVATLAWGGIASSGPNAISIAVRPSRYTFEALQRTGAFTVNLPSVEYAAETDYFGIVSGRNVNKFEVTGLTPLHGEFVDAPYIEEFPYHLECTVTHTLDLGVHFLFVGEVKDTKISTVLIGSNGQVSWEGANILTFDAMSRTYRAPGEIVGEGFSIGKKFISK
jgi:flavin reductase (DIM6/NTAB) family NADH-FMN oxidoreductase RutF